MREFYYTIGECDYRPYLANLLPINTNLLFPASSYLTQRRKRVPLMPPDYKGIRAADSGGFVASFRHNGEYQYSLAEYVAWLNKWLPDWAATMDFCCEDEITSGRPGIVQERQTATTMLAQQIFDEYKHCSWAWIPTVQGWQPADYERHAKELAPLIHEMQTFYQERGQAELFRVGIGTLCRRASVRMIFEIVQRVASQLPGVMFHLWGVKLDTFKSGLALPTSVVSADSAAWNGNFGKNCKKWQGHNMPRTEYNLTISLPVYQAKLTKAFEVEKQSLMF